MYKKVLTSEDMTIFNNIWMECWLEKGYDFEFYTGPADRFLIQDTSGVNIGTIEFKTYSVDERDSINAVYPFHKIDKIKEFKDLTVEVDKVAILKKHRGKNLDRLLTSIIDYCELQEHKYCVVLLERIFFIALKRVYKVPMDVFDEKIFYKGDDVIPAIIHVDKIYNEKAKFNWLVNAVPLR